MDAEAVGHNQSTGENLPSGMPLGMQLRQNWQPVATQKSQSLMTTLGLRTAAMMNHSLHLSNWYQRFSQRLQPWSGWQPLQLEQQEAEGLPADSGSPPIAPPNQELLNRPTAVRDLATPISQSLTASIPSISPIPLRPAIRLATVNVSPSQANFSSTDKPRNQASQSAATGGPQARGSDRPSPTFPSADQPTLQPRLQPTVAANPRREVRGGFPIRPLPLQEPSEPESSSPQRFIPVAVPISQGSPVPEVTSEVTSKGTSGVAPSVVMPTVRLQPEQQNTESSAIAQLIANSFLPTPMPGLEVRLVSMESPSAQSASPQDSPPAMASPPLPPVPPAAPTIKINEIADKVYQTLQRRQQFERERRGMS